MNLLNDILYTLQRCVQAGRAPSLQINELRMRVPGPILAHFDRQIAQGKKGMAEVRNGICGGCHLRLPVGLTAPNPAGGADLKVCEHCSAYLFFPPVAAPAKPEGAARPRRRYQAIATGW